MMAAQAPTTPNAPKPPVVLPGTGNNIIINPTQRGNPVLEHIRNVGTEYGDIVSDFQVGRTTGVLFLSLKYHRLHPEYIHGRIEKLGHSYSLRILLLLSDIDQHQDPIRELTKSCLINNITVMVAFTPEEAGHYLVVYKQYEHKPPDLIKERVDKDYASVLRTALTSISKVNKTDVETLRTSFGSFANIANATSDQLQSLPGFGQVKVKKMKDAFERPFRNNATSLGFAPSPLEQPSAWTGVASKAKGKEKQAAPPMTPPTPRRVHSPVWDIEFDSNPALPTIEGGSAPRNPPLNKRLSPTWDIELDLNDSD